MVSSWIALSVSIFAILSYHRASLIVWTCSFALALILATKLNTFNIVLMLNWILFLIIFIPLNVSAWRRKLLTQKLFQFYRKVMPSMSRTEREAISAGTVTWEGDLFRGNPNWDKLLALKTPTLTSDEQAFIDGPVEALCHMINDWDITHERADLPPEMWTYLKENGFFALGIPKQYGGKEFSAYAHSQIMVKLSGRSVTVSTMVSVPNSLGPAELLLHYGTEEQKTYYLPRLAKGEEVPCFALTSPEAGSDAGSMTDHGIICWGEHNGKKTLGIRLNWDKRYITLAPIATVIGLAFKLYDPEHLLGDQTEIGITCALIPRETPGITIGRRHFPLDTPFQNGPTQGKDVFIPVDWIIGGTEQAGKGWRMLMECLAAGRAITLPSSALGGAKMVCYSTGAYARIRKQFNLPIGRFEGIEEPLARIAAYTYIMDASRTLAIGAIDTGEKPSIASAIVKCHTTELGRKVACDAIDIQGGKGICLGPKNIIGRGYESAPIAITVEGANILTRNLIIFGQGAIRCHPYVLAELEAAHLPDEKQALAAFDKAIIKHIAFGISNFTRSLLLALTSSRIVKSPSGKTKRYFQHATRFSSALALISDVCMLSLGGNLKRKESISARLGDILSYLYLLSAVLKQYHVQGEQADDLPVVKYACSFCLYEIQESFYAIIRNLPNRPLAHLLNVFIFPLGRHFNKPKDSLNHKIAQLLMAPTDTRLRLSAGAYLTATNNNVLGDIQDALLKTIATDTIEKTIRAAQQGGKITGYTHIELAQSALKEKVVTMDEFDQFMQADAARKKVIAVDDFAPHELARNFSKDGLKHLHANTTST